MSVQVKGSGTIGGLDEGLEVVGIVTATTFSGNISGVGATFTGSTGNVRLDLHSTASGTGSQIKLHNDHGTVFFGQSGDTSGDLLVDNESNTNIRFFTNGTSNERLRITSTGQLLVGTGSASNRFKNGNGNGATPKFQFETANVDEQNDLSLTFGRNNAFGAEIILAKHRAASVGGYTVVQSGDRLGGINFAGSDGTHFRPAALIQSRVDGAPGTGDMPGRLEFHTTADNQSIPTERLRIDSSGAAILKNTAAATPRSDFLGSLKPISQIASTWNAYHSLTRHDAGSSYGPYLMLAKNRNDAYNSNGIVQDNDELGNISFQGNDGSVFREGARIRGEVDGTPASNQMPSALTFWTNNGSGLSENMRVTSNGIIDAPAQAGFYARMQNTKSNVMGGGASYYTIPFDTDSGSVCYDTHNSYNTSNGLYTVPTHGTGHYIVSTAVCLSSSVYGRGGECWFVQGSYRYFFDRKYFTSTGGLITGFYGTINIKLTAGQTIGVQGFISGGSQDVDVLGAAATDQVTWFTARKIA